ncbi:hypothetical protein CU097_015799, partial [Rhizopus azygosporus]
LRIRISKLLKARLFLQQLRCGESVTYAQKSLNFSKCVTNSAAASAPANANTSAASSPANTNAAAVGEYFSLFQ